MADAKTAVASKPVWVDLSSTDAAASREFYARLFGWAIEVNPDPAYGGYGLARIAGKDVAGIGGTQSPDMPSVWNVYIGTTDAADTAAKVEVAGGKVVAPPFDVGDQGRMAVFQDVIGAFISVWQPLQMPGAQLMGAPGAYGWAELNGREIEKTVPFYKQVFGWSERKSEMGDGAPPYTEFLLEDQSIAGAMNNPMLPAEAPNHWLIYFTADDVDASFKKAIDAGASELAAPQDFPGGRFAILRDPQGAVFGLLKM